MFRAASYIIIKKKAKQDVNIKVPSDQAKAQANGSVVVQKFKETDINKEDDN